MVGMTFRYAMLLLLLSLTPVAVRAEAPQTGWKQFDEDEGIKLWERKIPGQELPGFRGEVTIDAEPRKIIDVIEDWKHHTEWMHRCAESTRLADRGGGTQIMYNRTNPPWPVWDRDVILETKLDVSEDGKIITLNFHNIDSDLRPVPSKVVRMPKLVGFYKLERVGDKQTRVSYQVEADPGGSLPTWLAKRTARDLPFETLSRLRDRVRKTAK
jgi:hypothetical protein